MSTTDTWMPLYVGDYLADTGHLSACEHGAYLLLLMHYWRNGPLPDNDKQLAAIARTDRNVWDRDIGPTIREFFEVRDGKLHQKRADAERARAVEVSEKRRKAAENRWKNGSQTPPNKPNGAHHDEPYVAPHDANASAKAPAFGNAYVPPNAHASAGQMHTQSQSQSQDKIPPRGPPVTGGVRRRRKKLPRNGFSALDKAAQGPPVIDGVAEPDGFNAWVDAIPRRIADG